MQAKVWNDGPTDYREEFRGTEIAIPKGKFVEMDRYEAAAFLSQYIKPRKTDTGVHMNHKMLRMEVVGDDVPAKLEHRCQMCKGLFQSETELTLHSEAFHKEAIVAAEPKKAK